MLIPEPSSRDPAEVERCPCCLYEARKVLLTRQSFSYGFHAGTKARSIFIYDYIMMQILSGHITNLHLHDWTSDSTGRKALRMEFFD